MGKIKKIKSSHGDTVRSGGSLGQQILAYQTTEPTQHTSSTKETHRKSKEKSSSCETPFVEESLSKKILEEALKQQQQLQNSLEEDDEENTSENGGIGVRVPSRKHYLTGDAVKDEEGETWDQKYDIPENDDFFDPVEIDEEEEESLEKFMSSDPEKRQTLADIIQQKIAEKQSEVATQFSDVGLELRQLDPRLVDMYKGVRDVLSTYRSGKLPKAFKIIPKLINWEQILELTEPDKWTAAAMYQATRIFVSNLNAKLCQRFLNLVLLPRIRDDIAEFKKLNWHLYQALRKALFKPAAFFKGFLLPLCESRTCTLREATIVCSVMSKCSIPVLHAAAAMLKIAEMDYSGANSLFLRTLIDKKYTMPFRVIDGIVAHFVRLECDKREMPVLWHQALLSLAQRYKSDISSEQRESLLDLLKVHNHYMITPEVRRELTCATSRDIEDGSTMKEERMDE